MPKAPAIGLEPDEAVEEGEMVQTVLALGRGVEDWSLAETPAPLVMAK